MNTEEPRTLYEGIVYVNYHYGDHQELRLYDYVEYWGKTHKVKFDFNDMFSPFRDKKIRINIEVLEDDPEGVIKGDWDK